MAVDFKAKQEGFDAYDNGKDITDNPYPHGTDQHLSWNDGLQEAEDCDTEDSNDERFK